jgi:hypothetical protein
MIHRFRSARESFALAVVKRDIQLALKFVPFVCESILHIWWASFQTIQDSLHVGSNNPGRTGAYPAFVQLNGCLPSSCNITISLTGLYFRTSNKIRSPYSMELCSGIQHCYF